jgi:MFS family permease
LIGQQRLTALRPLRRDARILFATRMLRMFAYGMLSVVLVLYLLRLGLDMKEVGVLLTLALVGDALVSLWITGSADRIGRRRMLVAGSFLMVLAAMLFALTRNVWLLVLAATIGVISPSGQEVGPFLAIEQASLSQAIDAPRRTRVFAWYNLAGSCATAAGALAGGGLSQLLQSQGLEPVDSYRAVVIAYGGIGVALGACFAFLSPVIEVPAAGRDPAQAGTHPRFGLHRSRPLVLALVSLFALDAFAGGFVIQSIVAYWFQARYGVEPALLGTIFFLANLLAGASALASARLAARFGLLNTMVWTHIPSNILLILVPFMPGLGSTILLLLLRFSISQMDVPTRQSYMMAVVSPEERSAAGGLANVGRTVGAAISPGISGFLLGSAGLLALPFVISGLLKILYDLLLYGRFRSVDVPDRG